MAALSIAIVGIVLAVPAPAWALSVERLEYEWSVHVAGEWWGLDGHYGGSSVLYLGPLATVDVAISAPAVLAILGIGGLVLLFGAVWFCSHHRQETD
jgi:hypothetical protein